MTFWDKTKNTNTTSFPSNMNSATETIYGSDNQKSIGWIEEGGINSNWFIGLIYKVSFYNTIFGDSPGAREDMVNQYINDYYVYFDLGNQDQNILKENRIQK